MGKPAFVLFIVLFISSCQSSSTDEQAHGKDTAVADVTRPVLPTPKHNPEFRAQVKKDAVAEFREPTGRPEGDFIVKLYQTGKTMAFRVDVEYEGLPGSDTVRLPDLGTEPRPVLQRGTDGFSCVIGFLDNEKLFRELKLVRGRGDQLKITTLRHWIVMDHYRLVAQ